MIELDSVELKCHLSELFLLKAITGTPGRSLEENVKQ